MTEENEVVSEQLAQVQQMAHGVFVRALIATHPNPELLRSAAEIYLKNTEAFISEEAWGALPTELFRMTANSLMDEIGLASADGAA